MTRSRLWCRTKPLRINFILLHSEYCLGRQDMPIFIATICIEALLVLPKKDQIYSLFARTLNKSLPQVLHPTWKTVFDTVTRYKWRLLEWLVAEFFDHHLPSMHLAELTCNFIIENKASFALNVNLIELRLLPLQDTGCPQASSPLATCRRRSRQRTHSASAVPLCRLRSLPRRGRLSGCFGGS